MDRVLAEVYGAQPTWGVLDDEARFGRGLGAGEIQRAAKAISAATRAPTFFRRGEPDDLCDFVYVLCVGRTPCLVEVREQGVEAEAEKISEQYLRIAFSSLGRMATMQEVGFELFDGVISELPRPGVYDPKLLKRMRSAVDFIESCDIEHIDFGLLDRPAPAAPGDYVLRYGTEPTLLNFFFYAQPARVNSTFYL
jgi:hypothetical protein